MDWGLQIGATYFNSVDIIMFIIMIIGGAGGAAIGFISTFSKTAGYIVGFFVGLMFTVQLSLLFQQTFGGNAMLLSLLAFMALFAISYILVTLLGGALASIVDLSGALHAVDCLLGFFWCMFFTLVVLGVICYFLRMQHLFDVSTLFNQSQFITRLIDPLTPKAVKFVTENLH